MTSEKIIFGRNGVLTRGVMGSPMRLQRPTLYSLLFPYTATTGIVLIGRLLSYCLVQCNDKDAVKGNFSFVFKLAHVYCA